MKWDTLSTISELIAAFGVIISILYLAWQIRTNTKQNQQVLMQSLISKGTTFLTRIAHNSSSADIWSRGLSGMENLTNDGERIQFSYLVISILRAYEELFYHGLRFKLDKWVKDALEIGALDLYATAGFKQLWEVRKHWFSEEFSKKVSDSISQLPPINSGETYRNASKL
jgi:hypothetical protein